ncbi:folate-binding protein YgfZ [Phormidium tenue FACHB-886]|nr:folate-binding protein YgfZ [Phormidium tenue FACHB-886]
MIQALRDVQAAQGATFAETVAQPIPIDFGNNRTALEAARTGVALYDRSHWGRILLTGDDRLRFLHNQTTNNIQALKPSQGCDTVFVNSTGRTIDLVTAYVLDDAILLLTSPGYSQKLMEWMDRFIFFADKVEPKDITESTIAFTLLGTGSAALMNELGLEAITNQPAASHQVFRLGDMEIRAAVGSGLTTPGYTLIAGSQHAASLWQRLTAAGAVPLGEQAWEELRIAEGRPVPGRELTEDVNPLEAGLWDTISLSKGCYIGQETIARLHTYKGVKQQLWGVRLSQPAEPETPIFNGEEKIGKLTSCVETEAGWLGLAYIRTKAIAPELAVQVNGNAAELAALPYVTHEYPA